MRYLLLLSLLCATHALAQSTAFTYQGQLEQTGQAANGTYDLQFLLFDSDDFLVSTEVAGPVNVLDVPVSDGNFSVEVDFGTGIFDGSDLWLEIRVRESGIGGPLTTLAPRQKITPAPLALVAAEALIADDVPAGSIDASDIDAASVQRRVSTSCASGSSIRSISSTGFVTCEIDTVGDNISRSTDYNVVHTRSSPGNFSDVTGPNTSGSACFLTMVLIEDIDTRDEDGGCLILESSGRWLLRAIADDDASARCTMRCILGL